MELIENKFICELYFKINRCDVKGQLKDQSQGDKSKRACQGGHGGSHGGPQGQLRIYVGGGGV